MLRDPAHAPPTVVDPTGGLATVLGHLWKPIPAAATAATTFGGAPWEASLPTALVLLVIFCGPMTWDAWGAASERSLERRIRKQAMRRATSATS